jgi:hypothetical protein
MRKTALLDQLVKRSRYDEFRRQLAAFGASVTARTVKPCGPNEVHVRGCEVTLDEAALPLTKRQRSSFDWDSHWAKILEVCGSFGFPPDSGQETTAET